VNPTWHSCVAKHGISYPVFELVSRTNIHVLLSSLIGPEDPTWLSNSTTHVVKPVVYIISRIFFNTRTWYEFWRGLSDIELLQKTTCMISFSF
jgi:hypothetical protein